MTPLTLNFDGAAFKRTARHGAPIVLSLAALWVLKDHLPTLDMAAITALFIGFGPQQWIAAAVCTALSLTAVGGYDVTAARMMRLPVSDARAFGAGWRATAIAQSLGFGLVTGSLVRWRLLALPGKDGLWTATKMTSLVTAGFFYGWLVIAGCAALLAPGLPDQVWWLGALALWVGVCAAALSLRASPYGLKAYPPVLVLGRLCVLTLIDTLAACAVIYCFLPAGYVPFGLLYMSFLIAYSIGMISGIPGGVGPFEMCLLALLAPSDATPLIAALLAYRAVYFLAPAFVAGASLVAPPKPSRPRKTARAPALDLTWPAEAALVGQGSLAHVIDATTGGLACETTNSEIYLRDPVGPAQAAFIRSRRAAARRNGRRLMLYKCSATLAGMAQNSGLWTTPVASEAVLQPDTFAPNGRAFAQLRRKLRKAENAGVTCASGAPRLSDMHRIDREWQARCGAARGFSVGQFCPTMVSRQASFTAWQGDMPIAFLTCHLSRDRWVLDLMRSTENLPDGTMHALVLKALSECKQAGADEFSLCSVPFFAPGHARGLAAWGLRQLYGHSSSAQGLWRFKSSFAPEWRTEYLACDGPVGLALGLYDLNALITAPRPMPQPRDAVCPHDQTHDDYDNYEFASLKNK